MERFCDAPENGTSLKSALINDRAPSRRSLHGGWTLLHKGREPWNVVDLSGSPFWQPPARSAMIDDSRENTQALDAVFAAHGVTTPDASDDVAPNDTRWDPFVDDLFHVLGCLGLELAA